VFAWLRCGGDGAPPVAVVANFTPVPRDGYRIGLPQPGRWREILNSDAGHYGGSNRGNAGGVDAHRGECHGYPFHAYVTVPPLATVWFVHDPGA
jgi:1,4-alpha-glucan branching enzyme